VVRGKFLHSSVRAHCRSPKGDLALLQTAAFIGATLCGILHLHGFAVRYLVGSWLKILPSLVRGKILY
jgi:hypothetical protein